MRILRVVGLALWATTCHAQAAERRPESKCTDRQVKAFLTKASSVAPAQITPFCASYLHYPPQKTTTVKQTVADYSYSYKTVTSGTSSYTYTITLTSRRRNAARAEVTPAADKNRPAESLTLDSRGKVLGYASQVVSPACSCAVTRPIPPATVTKVIVKTVKATSTITEYQTTTYIEKTTTIAPPPAVCTGADPTFYLKLVDTNPARTDAYNNQYISSQSPPIYRGTPSGAAWTTTPSLANATLMTLECYTSNLRSVKEGWYANADYFVALTPVYFDPELDVARNEWQYLECTPGAGSSLSCYVQYPGGRRVMQTCPEYAGPDVYSTPVALGNVVYENGPVCYEKRLVMVPP